MREGSVKTNRSNRNKFSFFIFLGLFLCFSFLVSGCGEEPDCSALSEGDKYKTYAYDEELKKCVVTHSVDKDECGNRIAEDGETACNCPSDVSESLTIEEGGCSGNKGDYLEYYCNDETESCDLKVTDKVKKNSKLLSLREGGNFAIDAKVDYYIPFMTDRHKVYVELLLKDIMDTDTVKVKDLTIRKIYIVTQSKELLGDKSIDFKFENQYDEFKVTLPIDAFTFDTFDKEMRNVNLKLLVSYTKETYTKNSQEGTYDLYKSEDETVEIYGTFENTFKLINPLNKGEDLENQESAWG